MNDASFSAVAPWAHRYASFCRRHRSWLLGASLLWLLGTLAVAVRLPVLANISYLLPENTPSVQHLRALEKRANVLGTLMVSVRSADPARRAQVAGQLARDIDSLGPERVAHLTIDRTVSRRFVWEHRWLLASVEELTQAKAALAPWLSRMRQRQNPLALDFEDTPAAATDAATSSGAGADSLLRKLEQLERESHEDGPLVSADGTLQLLIVQTPFAAGTTHKSADLLERVRARIADATATQPGVQVGLAGDVVSSVEEERSILQGMAASTAATMLLVAVGLWAFYRSMFGTLALTYGLLCGTIATFAFTKLCIGHLNIATAFLASIVLGNGINFGIMLLARWFEALRRTDDTELACAMAIEGSWRGTLAAALAASAAYVSLTVTAFRGFRDFGCIASVGMLLCWLSAYVVVPPLLLWGAERGLLRARTEPPLGRWLRALVPSASPAATVTAAMWFVLSAGLAAHYLYRQPFEDDFRNIRSDSAALRREQAVMHDIDQAFGRGISGGFVLAVSDRAQAAPLLQKLRTVDAGKPEQRRLFGRLNGLDDLLPGDVDVKRALLADIRHLLLGPDAQKLSPALKRRIAPLTPPAAVPTWGDADIPDALAWPFTEVDGQRGRLLLASTGPATPTYSAPKLLAFSDAVRALDLGPDVAIGGSAFVFSDMVRLVKADGPRATLAATLAACGTVVCLLGLNLHALITLVAGALGVFSMLVGCSWLGLKINFLDFVALPITIGIGIDYAVNLAARSRLEGPGLAKQAVQGAGGAICLASYTTIIGYGSMLLSSNRGIRSFGHAAMLGEITCLVAGLIAAPLLLDVLWRPARNGETRR